MHPPSNLSFLVSRRFAKAVDNPTRAYVVRISAFPNAFILSTRWQYGLDGASHAPGEWPHVSPRTLVVFFSGKLSCPALMPGAGLDSQDGLESPMTSDRAVSSRATPDLC